LANVNNAGRAVMDADGALDEGARGGWKMRVVPRPRRWCQVRGEAAAGDGGQKARAPGRARHNP